MPDHPLLLEILRLDSEGLVTESEIERMMDAHFESRLLDMLLGEDEDA